MSGKEPFYVLTANFLSQAGKDGVCVAGKSKIANKTLDEHYKELIISMAYGIVHLHDVKTCRLAYEMWGEYEVPEGFSMRIAAYDADGGAVLKMDLPSFAAPLLIKTVEAGHSLGLPNGGAELLRESLLNILYQKND